MGGALNILTSYKAPSGGGVPTVSDADAQAFLNAAVITDTTQANAIDALVIGLKADSLWTPVKAIYPFVGGTASTHKWNLKNPLDTNAAFRLTFGGTVTHNSSGFKGNGSNGYAETYFTPSVDFTTLNEGSMWLYLTTSDTTFNYSGARHTSFAQHFMLRTGGGVDAWHNDGGPPDFASANPSTGWLGMSRESSSLLRRYIGVTNETAARTTTNAINRSLHIAHVNDGGSPFGYQHGTFGMFIIANTLDTTQAAKLRTRVETFQATLGRKIYDSDAQAFITAAGITDVTQKNAIDDLVVGLKADSLWTKCYALYPIVGGTSSTHKWNLKDPRDLDAAYRIVFSGTITHAATGMVSNGTNGYGDTKFNPSTVMTNTNCGATVRIRNNVSGSNGLLTAASDYGTINDNFGIGDYNGGADLRGYGGASLGGGASATSTATGTITVSMNGSRVQNLYINGSASGTTPTATQNLPNYNLAIMAGNYGSGGVQLYSGAEIAFAAMHQGFSSTEASNFHSRISTFQTALGR